MKKALIVIDYTNDFVATDGALTCGEPGQALEGKITSLIKQFIQEEELIVFANDLHLKEDVFHPESKLFPPHNIIDTDGRKLYNSIQSLYEQYADEENVVSMDKTRYSSFVGTPLQLMLNDRNIRELHLVGVCTDICVLHTAVDAYNLGFNCVIYQEGVASFNEAGHTWALQHFTNSLGFEVK